MSKYLLKLTAALGAAVVLTSAAYAQETPLGLGRAALPDEIVAWDKDVRPDGLGLPEGSGSVEDGEMIFADKCADCHGDFAEGVDNWPKLAGGMDTLDHEDPLKTVGSFWPYLSTTWDYVNRSMPFGEAQTLTADEVYAIVAYIVYSNDLVDDDFILSKDNFLDVEMPNLDGFILDDRADYEWIEFAKEPCMENCKDAVEITMRATVLDVTPTETTEEVLAEEPPAETTEAALTPEPVVEEVAVEEAVEEVVAEEIIEEVEAIEVDEVLLAAGLKVFKKCKSCHQIGENAGNKTGPQLNGVFNRTAAGVDGFRYSKAMITAGAEGLVWDEETLTEFLAGPRKYLKGTKMTFKGLKKEKDFAAISYYLQSFSD
ncbi:MAG: c-type cytochrome [Paracoccaceae bacterium]